MKKHILMPMLLLAGCAFMASCADDDYMELDKGDTELALTADAEEITLDEYLSSVSAADRGQAQ